MSTEQSSDILKHMSPQAFQALGMGHMAYVRPVVIENRQAFALHAADGTALTLVDSLEGAVTLARQNDLDAVVLH